jgi:hypothetical protein
MQAAFIDIGLERTAFLHASDIFDARHAGLGLEPPRNESIRSLVAEGDEILVQVVKDPLGTKGARLTTYITLPSRYLVYMPKGQGVGVSARIEDEGERERLRAAVQAGIDAVENAGYIVRTAAEDAPAERLSAIWLFAQAVGIRAPEGPAHPAGKFGARRPAAAPAHVARPGASRRGQGAHRPGERLPGDAGVRPQFHAGHAAAPGSV